MFTGLVSEVGEVLTINKSDTSAIVKIKAPSSIASLKVGDSIAVNGVCLTATSKTEDSFTADIMIQTLQLTSLSQLKPGLRVNLELAATMDMRMGGHIVQGHVDGVGKVIKLSPGEKWTQLDIHIPDHLARYVVNQGSIALDGVSLTVGNINDETQTVTVWLIPETLAKTNLSMKREEDLVNIEVDILAKYVERLVGKGGKNDSGI
jgi:riboflavin synthase